MARKKDHRQVLPFRIPFFRIFYSTTYTTLFILCLALLAITPASLIWTVVESSAYQYIFMVGGVYILTGLLTIFIYTSRLYTNRTVLAGVGKAYIPVEAGEVGKSVRKMVVKQLERSAIVAWEARPRDLMGEILQAEKSGVLPPESMSAGHNDYTVGRIISVDPASPPWGRVRHAGWSSPSHADENTNPDVQFATVIQELPNLIEARAVSLAPPEPTLTSVDKPHAMADPVVVGLLRRSETMGLRDYLTQLSYLRVCDQQDILQDFLRQYEQARFRGRPLVEAEFSSLMTTFAELLAGMTELDEEIIAQIRAQSANAAPFSRAEGLDRAPSETSSVVHGTMKTPSPCSESSAYSSRSPVTARTRLSRTTTPYLQAEQPSTESFSSVIHRTPIESVEHFGTAVSDVSSDLTSASSLSLPSDAGSVVRHSGALDAG